MSTQVDFAPPSGRQPFTLQRLPTGIAALLASVVQGGGKGSIAQVVLRLVFRIDEPQRKALGPVLLTMTQQLLLKGGWTEVEPGREYVRRTPLVGRVEVGGRQYLTDEQGFVRLPATPFAHDLRNVRAYRSGNEQPALVVPKLEIARVGEAPEPSFVTVPRGLPEECC